MCESDTRRFGSAEVGYNFTAHRDIFFRSDCAGRRLSRVLPAKHLRHKGVVHIWVAIFLLLLLLLAGLSLDTARVYLIAHQLQNTADAAALSGALFVKFDSVMARQQAIAIAFENLADREPVLLADNVGNDPNGDVVLGRYLRQSQIFVPATDPNALNNAVKVVARRTNASLGGPVALNFGPMVNVDTANISRFAVAMSAGATGAGLIALTEYPDDEPQYPNKGTGLQIGGNSNVQVNNGAVQVNSWSEDHPWSSFRAVGDFTIDCAELNIRGTVTPLFEDPFWDGVDYSVNEHTGPLPDPLEGLPELKGSSEFPAVTVQWGEQTINDSIITSNGVWSAEDDAYVLTIGPGYYPGGITMLNPSSKLVLQPGIYALGGTTKVFDPCTGELVAKAKETGLCISGGTFVAEGVMLYPTDSLEGRYGVVSIQGGTQVSVLITEYDSGGNSIYDGMAIFQDRANTEESYVTGSTNVMLKGTLYFKNANFHVGGDGIQAGTQLIAGTVEVDGGSNVLINYDGRNWAVGYHSFLVM